MAVFLCFCAFVNSLQVSDFIKFVKLNWSQNSSNWPYPWLYFFTFILKSPIAKIFSNHSIALLKDIARSSKNIERLLDSSGLYVLILLAKNKFIASSLTTFSLVYSHSLAYKTPSHKFYQTPCTFIFD